MQIKVPEYHRDEPDFLRNLAAGFKNQQTIDNIPIENKMALANLIKNQVAARYAEPSIVSKLQNIKSQIDNRNFEMNFKPKELDLKRAKYELDLKRYSPEQLQATLNYKNAAAQNLGNSERNLTQTGKTLFEQSNVEEGKSPSGKDILSPEEQDYYRKIYNLKQDKLIPPFLQKSLVQAKTIDTLLEQYDPEKFTKFYGPQGRKLAAAEALKGIKGEKVSDDYQEYLNFIQRGAPAISAQMRAFLSDSLSPEIQKKYASLVVPPGLWTSNPDLARKSYAETKKVYNLEKKSRIDAINIGSFYIKNKKESSKEENKMPSKEQALAILKAKGRL